MTIHMILLILAMVLFLGAALHVEHERISFMPLGLFFWVLATVIQR